MVNKLPSHNQRLVADRSPKGYMVHCFGRLEGVAAVIISENYPALAAHAILAKVLDEFLTAGADAIKPILRQTQGKGGNNRIEVTFPDLRKYLYVYQDQTRASDLRVMQRDLDETKILLHETVEPVSDQPPPRTSNHLIIMFHFLSNCM
jgi:synaptobrevin homolog YKT6